MYCAMQPWSYIYSNEGKEKVKRKMIGKQEKKGDKNEKNETE